MMILCVIHYYNARVPSTLDQQSVIGFEQSAYPAKYKAYLRTDKIGSVRNKASVDARAPPRVNQSGEVGIQQRRVFNSYLVLTSPLDLGSPINSSLT